MEIKNCVFADLEIIFNLFDHAIAYQKTKNTVVWPVFNKQDIIDAISEKRQFKVVIENKIACVWTYTFGDQFIWGNKDKNDAIYIHKIATNPDFKGQNMVQKIVNFSTKLAIEKQKLFLRMDTVGQNKGLISHYTKCGFTFLGMFAIKEYINLPAHYHEAEVSLFELKVQ